MDTLKYGVAYYFEYLPFDRIDEDIKMMQAANINVVRIGESTWSTYEPLEGEFDFSKLIYTLDKMQQAGMQVIVGTPTYAFPTWLAKKYPEVLAMHNGQRLPYGARQIMDIAHPTYRYYAERVIRKMLTITAKYDNVIGYQLDNETKQYGNTSPNVQAGFVTKLREKYHDNLEALNADFGLDYWSNRINAWEDFPSVTGTINASLAGAFAHYQRDLVTEYLDWLGNIVREYTHDNQFLTQNFDYEWRGHSFGVQPDVNHFEAGKTVDVMGVDIYHPSQRQLTGAEISFGGDISRSIKQQNYIVLETQAQAFKNWTPYPGQLYQLALAHVASGANMVGYWHWHSIHNSFETYWKGLVGHDFQPNPVYNEAIQVGADFKRLSNKLVNLKHKARVAFVVDNDSLTATSGEWIQFKPGDDVRYNDVFRRLYDAFYRQNIRTDILDPTTIDVANYDLLVVPMLYTATDEFLQQLNEYVAKGGHVLYTFKSGFSNENVKVRTTVQPGIISEAVGAHYELFVDPNGVTLTDPNGLFTDVDLALSDWAELLEVDDAKVLAGYSDEYHTYAAITENNYGEGIAWYMGAWASASVVERLADYIATVLQLKHVYQTTFPTIVKTAQTTSGTTVDFIFNFSRDVATLKLPVNGQELIGETAVTKGSELTVDPWGVKVIERGE